MPRLLLLLAFILVGCSELKRPLYKYQITGTFGLTERLNLQGHSSALQVGDLIQPGHIILTGKNSRIAVKIAGGHLLLYSNSRLNFATFTDYHKKTHPKMHMLKGTFLVSYKRKIGKHIISSSALRLSSQSLAAKLSVDVKERARLQVIRGSGMIKKNYPALMGAGTDLIDSSLLLTDIDNSIQIGEIISQYQSTTIKGNNIRI